VLLGIELCEPFQPDAFAAVTAIPPWCWLLACAGLGSLGFVGAARWERIVAGVLLLSFLICSVEQSRSLSRSAWYSLFTRRDSHLRVVTINCDGGSRQAADEAARFEPDIVLLQESPNEQALHDMAQAMFGSAAGVVWSPDCSIVARGQLRPTNVKEKKFVQATLTLVDGRTIEIVCLRLSPPIVRYDLWAPTCWTDHAEIRRKHRAEATAIANALSSVPNERPILIGGDCNAPSGDGALHVWFWRLHDAFSAAGLGWGSTVLNGIPVLRFDQLWCSDNLEAIAMWSVKAQYSDHRLVVGDFNITH
jgi:endonuclease/exonuclease/phosphatase (EEP) superfamily protein YafD